MIIVINKNIGVIIMICNIFILIEFVFCKMVLDMYLDYVFKVVEWGNWIKCGFKIYVEN